MKTGCGDTEGWTQSELERGCGHSRTGCGAVCEYRGMSVDREGANARV
jgi:hypothetical protein